MRSCKIELRNKCYIISYITKFVLLKLDNRNFLSLHKFLCPTLKVRFDILHQLSLNLTECLLILRSFLGNIRSRIAKKMEGQVTNFDMLH
jgi:hypothetical protein